MEMMKLQPAIDALVPQEWSSNWQAASTVALLAVAWASLELVARVTLRAPFLRLLDANPDAAAHDPRKREVAATQLLPRVVCAVHNLMQVPLALTILFSPVFCSSYVARMGAATQYSTLVMALSAGYFAYDTAECIYRYEHEGPEFLFHGVFCFIVFTSLVVVRKMHWYGAGFLMWELSTPFVHLRWLLYKIGCHQGPLYAANGVAGMLVFFLARICWGPVVSLQFWKDSIAALAQPEVAATMPIVFVWFYRSCTVTMNGLNMHWFSKMLRLALDSGSGGGGGGSGKRAGKEAAAAGSGGKVVAVKAE